VNLIKKSLLIAIVMLVAYHFLLPHLSHKFYQINGSQRGNYLRAQRYLYDIPDKTNVIVGSSMSLELNDQTLGPSYFKLSLPGGSIQTALEIIRRSKKRPSVLLIETNNLEWDVDRGFVEDLFNPYLFELRRHSAIFREEGRPSNFVVGITEAIVRKACQFNAGPGERAELAKHADAPAARLSGQLFGKVMDINRETLQHTSPPALLAKNANRLGEVVDALANEGSKCVFFEMPFDDSLMDLPLPAATRKAVAARFPGDKYSWLRFARDHNYETVDGIHLVRPEADGVTKVFLQQVADVVQESKQSSPHIHALAHESQSSQ
jgi:hypothetical protein